MAVDQQIDYVGLVGFAEAEVRQAQGVVDAAKEELNATRSKLESDLRTDLVGKTVCVTGYTELVEVMDMSSMEWIEQSRRMDDAEARIKRISFEERHRTTKGFDPLLWLELGDGAKNQVAMRLKRLYKFEIVEQPKEEAGQ